MNEHDQFDQSRRILASLQDVPAPDPLRKASARHALLERAARYRGAGEPRGRRGVWLPLRLVGVSVGTILVTLAMLTGVVYAADTARPGDLLYAVDRFAEQAQLQLARDPERAARLLLAQSDERLLESEQLAAQGSVSELSLALDNYARTLSALDRLLSASPPAQVRVSGLVEQTLSNQQSRLLAMSGSVPPGAAAAFDRAVEAEQRTRQEESPGSGPGDSGPPAEPPGNGNPHPPPQAPKKQKDKQKHDHGNPHGSGVPGPTSSQGSGGAQAAQDQAGAGASAAAAEAPRPAGTPAAGNTPSGPSEEGKPHNSGPPGNSGD